MPIPFGKAFSYGTFLQYLRSPGLISDNSSTKARNFATRSNRRLGCPNDEYRKNIHLRRLWSDETAKIKYCFSFYACVTKKNT